MDSFQYDFIEIAFFLAVSIFGVISIILSHKNITSHRKGIKMLIMSIFLILSSLLLSFLKGEISSSVLLNFLILQVVGSWGTRGMLLISYILLIWGSVIVLISTNTSQHNN